MTHSFHLLLLRCIYLDFRFLIWFGGCLVWCFGALCFFGAYYYYKARKQKMKREKTGEKQRFRASKWRILSFSMHKKHCFSCYLCFGFVFIYTWTGAISKAKQWWGKTKQHSATEHSEFVYTKRKNEGGRAKNLRGKEETEEVEETEKFICCACRYCFGELCLSLLIACYSQHSKV